MEFGANNIKKSADKLIVAEFSRDYFTASNVQTSGDPDQTYKIPLLVIDNEGNVVTEI